MSSAVKTWLMPARMLRFCGGRIFVACIWFVGVLVLFQAGCGSSGSDADSADPDDQEAVAQAFVTQLVEGTITPGTIGFHEIPEAFVQDGKALYARYGCPVCHGMDGHGDGPVSYTLKPPPRDFRDPGAYRIGRDVVTIARTLKDGMPNSPSMVPFPHIKDEERFKIAMYVASLQPSADALEIDGAWVRATPPNRDVTAAYLVIRNRSDQPRELLSVETPSAEYTELHTMRQIDDLMEMEKIERLVVPARGEAVLEPGGNHIMLFGVRDPLAEGEVVSLTLRFDDQSTRTVKAEVLKSRP